MAKVKFQALKSFSSNLLGNVKAGRQDEMEEKQALQLEKLHFLRILKPGKGLPTEAEKKEKADAKIKADADAKVKADAAAKEKADAKAKLKKETKVV